jgi:hypothetical protein
MDYELYTAGWVFDMGGMELAVYQVYKVWTPPP